MTIVEHAIVAFERVLTDLCADPGEMKAAMVGTLAGLLIRIPDDTWEQICEESKHPCGVVDCDCHDTSAPLFDALDAVRTKGKRYTEEARKHGWHRASGEGQATPEEKQ